MSEASTARRHGGDVILVGGLWCPGLRDFVLGILGPFQSRCRARILVLQVLTSLMLWCAQFARKDVRSSEATLVGFAKLVAGTLAVLRLLNHSSSHLM